MKVCNGDCYILQQLFLCKIWCVEVNERVRQLWFLAALFLFLSFYHYFSCCMVFVRSDGKMYVFLSEA